MKGKLFLLLIVSILAVSCGASKKGGCNLNKGYSGY